MRLIDAVALERIIQEQVRKCMIKVFNPSVNLILQDIRNAPTIEDKPVNSWISVDDRLPEASYDCLVWYSCDTPFGKSESVGISYCSRCDWYTKHLDGDNIVVLYWEPLHKPPKEDKNT